MVVNDILQLLLDDPSTKIVVATTVKIAIAHVATALSHAEVKSVRIDRPNASAEQEIALTEFKSSEAEAPSVLLLHAGVAAAGLTLTCARHMMLLEPFFKRGEELQTMNRCHRIGQDNPVEVTTYFTEGSLEERLLAFRDVETEEDSAAVLRDTSADDSRGLTPAKARFILGLNE